MSNNPSVYMISKMRNDFMLLGVDIINNSE